MITYLHFVIKAVIVPILPVLVFMVSISTCDAALNIEVGGGGGWGSTGTKTACNFLSTKFYID